MTNLDRARTVVEDFESTYYLGLNELEIEKFTQLIAAALDEMREECAKVAEQQRHDDLDEDDPDFEQGYDQACLSIAAAIRQGGKP